MKQTPKMQRWLPSVITGLALAGSTSFCLAQSAITQNFNTGASTVSDFGIDFGTGTIEWGSTEGVGGTGCLKVTLDATNAANSQVAAKWTITGGPIKTSDYLQVDYDIKFDPVSGVDANSMFGNYQEVFRDAAASWESHWIGAIFPPSDWTHRSFAVPNNGKLYPTVDWVLQGTAPYTTNVVFYVDNIVISPTPNPYVWLNFTNDASGWSQEGWALPGGTAALNTSEDAGGGFAPLGSLQLSNAFTSGWQQSWFYHSVPWSPNRWDYFEFDVKVDTANSVANGDGSYGEMSVDLRAPGYTDKMLPPGSFTLTSAYTSWQHVRLSLSNHVTNDSSGGIDLIMNGTHAGPVQVFVDNIKLTKLVTRPAITGLLPGTPGGVKIYVDGNADNQWDQEAITAPSADCSFYNFFPIYQTPASYSFTLTKFPDPSVAPGFQAHAYIFNGDTDSNFGYNQTYSGAPYNVPDYMGLLIENGTNGNVVATFEWKTNFPSFNTTNRMQFTLPYSSANGTWAFNFTDNTHVTVVGPDGAAATNFTIPDFVNDANYNANFTPSTSCIQFGVAKNDVQNSGVNNSQGTYFTHVLVTNATYPAIYDDTFNGPGLTGKYAWRVAQYWKFGANRTLWQPYGTAYWLKYGEPAAGYTVESAASPLGTWGDAGVTYTYADTSGTNHFAAVPTASLPAGNAAYFRLKK
jgi:hypothetical protein